MKRLAIVCTHPIQYYSPLFKLLAESNEVNLQVFYTWGESSLKKFDPGFNKVIEWDIPLLEGFNFTFLPNTAKSPGSEHFFGIINPSIITELENFKPDVILVYGWAYYSHLKVIKHFSKKTTLWFRGDSTLLNYNSNWKNKFRSIFLKWLYKHIDIALYVGTENKKYYLKYGMAGKQLYFAPHAIDNKRFNSAPDSTSVRETLNIPENDIIILFAGKFEMVKNPTLLLDAFILNNIPNTHLIFVGNGSLEIQLKENAKNHPHIHFVDFKNQTIIPKYYQACNLFCLPSLSETWGLAVNEAMACGKAILISDMVGCAIDLVKPGVNGEIFKSNDLASLSSKLSTILADKIKLQLYGTASKEIIEKWSFEHSSNNILEVLRTDFTHPA